MLLKKVFEKLKNWKTGLRKRRIWQRFKFIVSVGIKKLKESGKFPCAVYYQGVGVNSNHCSYCDYQCSRVTGKLRADSEFIWPRCSGLARQIDRRQVTKVVVGDRALDVVD